MKLHQHHEGVWIVPELVAAVTVRSLSNAMYPHGYVIEAHMVGGGPPVALVTHIAEIGVGAGFHTADEWIFIGQLEARDIVAWIDERRTEPLEVVRA